MSLNWNAKAMTERGLNIYCTREDGEYLNPITEALVWATMVVGCDGRNIQRFAQRVREYEMACGPLMHWPRPEYAEKALAANVIRSYSMQMDGYISKAELMDHEGFTTNASTLTEAQWGKHLAQLIHEKGAASLRREMSKPA